MSLPEGEARRLDEDGYLVLDGFMDGALLARVRERVGQLFAEEGVSLDRVIIGHSCGSADLKYHADMLDRGCYLGFDRFGLDFIHPDRLRLAALIGLLGVGFEKQLVLSHDSVACWKGRGLPDMDAKTLKLIENWNPTHIFKNIVPALRKAGVTEEKIDALLVK